MSLFSNFFGMSDKVESLEYRVEELKRDNRRLFEMYLRLSKLVTGFILDDMSHKFEVYSYGKNKDGLVKELDELKVFREKMSKEFSELVNAFDSSK